MFVDKASGKDTGRPELDELLAFVREGHEVIVPSMDRLARDLDDLRQLVGVLTGLGRQAPVPCRHRPDRTPRRGPGGAADDPVFYISSGRR